MALSNRVDKMSACREANIEEQRFGTQTLDWPGYDLVLHFCCSGDDFDPAPALQA